MSGEIIPFEASAEEQTTTVIPTHYRNDLGYADAFVEAHSKRVKFNVTEKMWLVFTPQTGWERDSDGNLIAEIASDYARKLFLEACEAAKAASDPKQAQSLISAAVSLGNRQRIGAMIDLARSNPQIAVRALALDKDPFIIGVENGSVDIRDGEFFPHDPTQLVTRRLSTKFQPSAKCPVFDKFLAEVQPDIEMRGFLKRWAGYCLSGVIREHILPFHYGCGANGKSVFLQGVMATLLGAYSARLTDALVYSNERGNSPALEIAGLAGKRFACGEENRAGAGLNENFLKAATGNDILKGRFHYANHIEFFPQFKTALVGNHRPKIETRDYGFWRRFKLIDWPVTIPSEKRDLLLTEKLRAEFPGILNWCLAGAKDWLEFGLNPPETCELATDKFRADSDSLASFKELFEESPDGWIAKSLVFDAYRKWATEEGIPQTRQMTKRALSFRLAERGWLEGRQGHAKTHVWLGVKFGPEGNDSDV